MAINNPKTLASLSIATPNNLSICDGLPMFDSPGNRPARFGVQRSGSIFDKSVGNKIVGLDVNLGYGVFFGICGPAWATQVTVKGEYGQDQANPRLGRLDFTSTSNDAMACGFVLGASTGINASITGRLLFESISTSLAINFDLISICNAILAAATGGNASFTKVTELLNIVPSAVSSYGLLGGTSDSYAQNKGQVSASALLYTPINLWGLLVLASQAGDEFGIGEAVLAFNEALDAVGTDFVIGPTLGLGVEVTPKITGLTLDNITLGALQTGPGSAMSATFDGVLPTNPAKIGLNFTQSNNLDFGYGFMAQLTVLTVFSLGTSFTVDVGAALPFKIGIGSYQQNLSVDLPKQATSTAQAGQPEWREVVFA